MPVTVSCQEIGEKTSIPAQLIEKHPEVQYGSEMYYLYKDPDNPTIYIVMHGLDNRLVMNGISVKSALNKILKKNKDKLGYFSTIKVVCCFSNKHKNFFSKTWNADVEFIANSDKKLIVHAGTRGFKFSEWED